MELDYINQLLNSDRDALWHPYSSLLNAPTNLLVSGAKGTKIELATGQQLIDGMASWWSVIHGYNHPVINAAIIEQVNSFSHVMFGGLTHEPAIKLAELLLDIVPSNLKQVFFSDSGSVSVEVAIKMAVQYWHAKGKTKKSRLLTIRNGYHGDTIGAMSVCDPVTGMHSLFSDVLPKNLFAPAPNVRFEESWQDEHIAAIRQLAKSHQGELAAIILEPIVQGAGGMRFYSAEYLRQIRALCDETNLLLIVDEIATGFGRTGKMFACEHAQIQPDIMCLGKALTGGYMSLAATLATGEVGRVISEGAPGVFMHGPTFMANPLACSAALASTQLLLDSPWSNRIKTIQEIMSEHLAPAIELPQVRDVRVLGGIGVLELENKMNMATFTQHLLKHEVWLRPFGNLLYVMPPYIIKRGELIQLCEAMVAAAQDKTLFI